jgi:hypothetical protein
VQRRVLKDTVGSAVVAQSLQERMGSSFCNTGPGARSLFDVINNALSVLPQLHLGFYGAPVAHTGHALMRCHAVRHMVCAAPTTLDIWFVHG